MHSGAIKICMFVCTHSSSNCRAVEEDKGGDKASTSSKQDTSQSVSEEETYPVTNFENFPKGKYHHHPTMISLTALF